MNNGFIPVLLILPSLFIACWLVAGLIIVLLPYLLAAFAFVLLLGVLAVWGLWVSD